MQKLQTGICLAILMFTCLRTFAQDDDINRDVLVLEHENPVYGVAWHPSGDTIATASGNSIFVWHPETGELLHTFQAYEGDVYTISWSPLGDRLLSIGEDWVRQTYTLKMWDANTYALQYTLMSGAVVSAHWSPDGEQIVTVNGDSQASDDLRLDTVFTVWGSRIGDLKAIFRLSITGLYNYDNYPDLAVWDTNERFIGVNRDGPASVWDVSELEMVGVFPGVYVGYSSSGNRNQDAALNGTRQLLALTANDNVAQEFGVRIVDLSTREHSIIGTEHGVTSLAWNPDDTLLAIGDSSGIIHIWDASSQDIVSTMQHSNYVNAIDWSPNGAFIASAEGLSNTVRVWSVSQ